MIPQLRSKWRLNRLARQWKEYRGVVLRAMAPDGALPNDRDSMDLKGRIAALIPSLSEASPSSLAAESEAHAQGMTYLLKEYPVAPNDDGDLEILQAFEQQWQDHYIFLNKLKGMKAGPHRGLTPSGRFVPTGVPTRRGRSRVRGPLVAVGQLLLWGAFVYVGVLLLQALARWNKARAGAASPTGAVGNSVADAAKMTAAGIGRFFLPVTKAYGPEVSTILFVVLILGFGYLVFRRH